MFDDYTGTYVDDTPQVLTSGFSDFFNAARDKLTSVLPAPGTPAGSQLMDAIYSLGRGAFDQARDQAVGSFLRTGEGQRVQQSAVNQTVQKYMPLIVIVIIALLGLGFFAARR